jgi:hypothetical protein
LGISEKSRQIDQLLTDSEKAMVRRVRMGFSPPPYSTKPPARIRISVAFQAAYLPACGLTGDGHMLSFVWPISQAARFSTAGTAIDAQNRTSPRRAATPS